MHPPGSEFRGHSAVTEIDPNRKQILHQFYQGQSDDHCTPPINSASLMQDICFLHIRDREFLKGREYDTVHAAGALGGPTLSEDQHFYGITLYGNYGQDNYSDDRYVGLWRAYRYETETLQLAFDSTQFQLSKAFTYTYDLSGTLAYSPTYGNLLAQDEFYNGSRLRHTEHTYTVADTATTYIVDRKRSDNVYDGQNLGVKLARTLYSDETTPIGAGASWACGGSRTLVRQYYDLGLRPLRPDP